MLRLLDVNISATTALLPWTRDRSDASVGNAAVSFAACPVCGLPTYNLHNTVKNNGQELGKLGEGVEDYSKVPLLYYLVQSQFLYLVDSSGFLCFLSCRF